MAALWLSIELVDSHNRFGKLVRCSYAQVTSEGKHYNDGKLGLGLFLLPHLQHDWSLEAR